MIDILLLCLRPALLWESNPWRYWYLTLVVLFGLVVDVIVAHTTWALIAGWPKKGEWTVSQTLERLCKEGFNPDTFFFIAIARKINRMSTTKRHIKAVL